MKSPASVFLKSLGIAGGLSLCTNSTAAVVIVDTFDQGGFSISSPGNPNPGDETVNLPFGQRRYVALSSNSTDSTVMSSTLNSNTGTLTFASSGASMSVIFPLSLSLVYSGGQTLHSIPRDGEFILGFPELSGVGTLYIELGGSLGLEGVTRVDLTGPGEVRYPVSSVYEGSSHTLDAFNVLTFRFEARSQSCSAWKMPPVQTKS